MYLKKFDNEKLCTSSSQYYWHRWTTGRF